MKIYLINLKRSTERRNFMEQQLRKLGLDYEYFEAVEGNALSQVDLEAECDLATSEKKGILRSLGFVGCALSHQRIYKKMVAENIEKALILEDDIVLSEDLRYMLPLLENQLKPNEALLLYFVPGEFCKISTQNTAPIYKKYQFAYPVNTSIFSTGAYMISLEVATKMAQITTPIRYFADEWDAFMKKGGFSSIRCVQPFPILPSFARSDIGYTDGVNRKIIQFRDWIEDNNIFPFSWLLRLKRRWQWKKRQNVTVFTDDVSPFTTVNEQ